MKRDFTRANFDNLVTMLRELDAKANQEIMDRAGRLTNLLGTVSQTFMFLDSPLRRLAGHIRSLIEAEEKARVRVRQIFEDVSRADRQYRNETVGFGLTRSALQDLQNAMKSLTELNDRGCAAVDQGGNLLSVFNAPAVHEGMKIPNAALGKSTAAIENGAAYTAEDFRKVPNGIKQERIREVEQEHPEYEEKFREVLSDPDISEQERMDIKYMAYCAPEPYRSIYLEHLDRYRVSVEKSENEKEKGSWYSNRENRIRLEDENMAWDDCGSYNTFFHESGHAVDDFEDDLRFSSGSIVFGDKTMRTNSYEYNGKTLNELVTEDTRNHVRNIIENDPMLKELKPAQKEELMRRMNLADDSKFRYQGNAGGDMVMNIYIMRLRDVMHKDLVGRGKESCSDVYGGVTNNAIKGDWGHSKGEKDKTYEYWYDEDGNPTGRQERELWAEFFAAKMTNDVEELEYLQTYFPQAYVAMEKMAEEMAKSGNGTIQPQGSSGRHG